MNRRDLVTAGPAMLAAATLPATAMPAAEDSAIGKLFRQWTAAQQAAENAPDDIVQCEFDALVNRACDLGDQIMALPAADASEWMLKLIAWTDYGAYEFQSRDANSTVWDEARALAGSAT